jgi:hypothetical protein
MVVVRQLSGVVLFALIAVVVGHWLGGGAALGRVDAALLVPTLVGAAVLFQLLPDRWRPAPALFAILVPTALLVILWAGIAVLLQAESSWAGQWLQLAVLAGASVAALALVRALWPAIARWWWGVRFMAITALVILWWLASHVGLGAAYSPAAVRQPGKTLVLTGLPLRMWPGEGKPLDAPQDSAALVYLRARVARETILVDGLATGSVGPNDDLLLAHPLALQPETLVEIDRFVRSGGRAVILADGLSSWPPHYALGDPRNPPVTSLLTPLLDHWGLTLEAPAPDSAQAGTISVSHGGHRLLLHSVGYFSVIPPPCRPAARNDDGRSIMVTCRIGKGTILILADADLLFDPLWRPDPDWASHLRHSDNVQWLTDQLNQNGIGQKWGLRPIWRGEGLNTPPQP